MRKSDAQTQTGRLAATRLMSLKLKDAFGCGGTQPSQIAISSRSIDIRSEVEGEGSIPPDFEKPCVPSDKLIIKCA
jgi:hypothetical protein